MLNSNLTDLGKSVSDGKTLVANVITAKGVTTATDASFATMASNIGSISTIPEPQTLSFHLIGTRHSCRSQVTIHCENYSKAKTTGFSYALINGGTMQSAPDSNLEGITTINREINISGINEFWIRAAHGSDWNQNAYTDWTIMLYN